MTVLRPREPHVVESNVAAHVAARLHDGEHAVAVVLGQRADVRPVEVLALTGRRPAVVVDGNELGVGAGGGVVTETRHHADGVLHGVDVAAGHVLDFVEPGFELRPVQLLGVPRDDAVHTFAVGMGAA